MTVAAPRVALAHDWLTGMRGGEYVLEAIAELFPRAELFTLLHVPASVSPDLTALRKTTGWLQRMPRAERSYRHYLPLMPLMAEAFDLAGYDLVISSSHCVAKGVKKAPGSVHVSYVHAPMRYMWDRFDDYFGPGRASLPTRAAARLVRPYLQWWDRRSSGIARVDAFIANSRYVADQIGRLYGREARVVHPFADLSRFGAPRRPNRTYLMVGALAPNKRVDLAIKAFNRIQLPLMIVGGGQERDRLKRLAGPTIDILGVLSNRAIADLYSKCRAFIFPGVEDFGITPLEAMAAGMPVIAYGEGGAAESVTERTGILFRPQTPDALAEAVLRFEKGEVAFDEAECRARAAQFTRERFQRGFREAVDAAWRAAGKEGSPFPTGA